MSVLFHFHIKIESNIGSFIGIRLLIYHYVLIYMFTIKLKEILNTLLKSINYSLLSIFFILYSYSW